MKLDYIPPKVTASIFQPYGFIKYAEFSSHIYLCAITETEPNGQSRLMREFLAVAQQRRLPVQAVAPSPERVRFFQNRGFVAVSQSQELGYTVMVWNPAAAA